MASVRREGFAATPNSRLCSDHFVKEDYIEGRRRRSLRSDAVPSVFGFPGQLAVSDANIIIMYFILGSYLEF